MIDEHEALALAPGILGRLEVDLLRFVPIVGGVGVVRGERQHRRVEDACLRIELLPVSLYRLQHPANVLKELEALEVPRVIGWRLERLQDRDLHGVGWRLRQANGVAVEVAVLALGRTLAHAREAVALDDERHLLFVIADIGRDTLDRSPDPGWVAARLDAVQNDAAVALEIVADDRDRRAGRISADE